MINFIKSRSSKQNRYKK